MQKLVAMVAAAGLMTGMALAEELSVAKDQSTVVKLVAPASTIVVGNPAIADVTMQDGNTAFVTGKGFGSTNVIAMDSDGRQIASFKVFVTASAQRSVKLIRGTNEVTLSCSPKCEPAVGGGERSSPAPIAAPSAPPG